MHCASTDPTVRAPAVVADQKPIPIAGFDQVQILPTACMNKNDATDLDCGGLKRTTVTTSPSLTLPRIEFPYKFEVAGVRALRRVAGSL
jgi:hypothetical protein